MKSALKKRCDYVFESNVHWSLPGLDYYKSMYHEYSKVAGDYFLNFFEVEFCI